MPANIGVFLDVMRYLSLSKHRLEFGSGTTRNDGVVGAETRYYRAGLPEFFDVLEEHGITGCGCVEQPRGRQLQAETRTHTKAGQADFAGATAIGDEVLARSKKVVVGGATAGEVRADGSDHARDLRTVAAIEGGGQGWVSAGGEAISDPLQVGCHPEDVLDHDDAGPGPVTIGDCR
jgi:hypothetical protein